MEENKTRRYVTPKYINGMFLFILVFYVVGALGVALILDIIRKATGQYMSVGIIQSLLLSQSLIWIGLGIYVLIGRRNPFVKSDFIIHQKPGRVIGTIALIPVYTGTVWFGVVFLNLVTMMFAENHVEGMDFMFEGYNIFVRLLVMAVVPAISEELICRGAIFGGLKKHGILKAIIISGIFFGVLHLNINQFAYAAFLGIMLAFLNEATGCIYSSMFVHFLINASSVVMMYFTSDKSNELLEEAQSGSEYIQSMTVQMKVAVIVIYGVLAVVGITVAVLLAFLIAYINGRLPHLLGIFKKNSYNPYAYEDYKAKRMFNIFFYLAVIAGFAYMIVTEFVLV